MTMGGRFFVPFCRILGHSKSPYLLPRAIPSTSQLFSTFVKQKMTSPSKQSASGRVVRISRSKLRDPPDPILFSPPRGIAPQQFDYFLVLDFEATCQASEDGPILPVQEIIEFPVMKVSARSFEIESTFHSYVRPKHRPVLTSFCTNLTGIIQEMVDGQPSLPVVLHSFADWLVSQGLLASVDDPDPSADDAATPRWIFVTCGDWDLKTALPTEAASLGIELPSYFSRWINIKVAFGDAFNRYPNSMMAMLKSLQIEHTGRHHSGIDDVRNICAVVKAIAENAGYVYRQTWHGGERERRLIDASSDCTAGLSR